MIQSNQSELSIQANLKIHLSVAVILKLKRIYPTQFWIKIRIALCHFKWYLYLKSVAIAIKTFV